MAAAAPRGNGGGLTYVGGEKAELDAMKEGLHEPELPEDAPLPLMALAQFYAHDVPDLAHFTPPGTDLLQVLWCPFDNHTDEDAPAVQLRWRRAAEIGEVLLVQPEPRVVEYEEYVPEPCVLHPEQIVECPYQDYLPSELNARIQAWEQDSGDGHATYQYELSIANGWKIGGWDTWHLTDLCRVYCDCGEEMRLLLTIDSREWEGGHSWKPLEEPADDPDLPLFPLAHMPTQVTVGRCGSYRAFVCPADPRHPHRMSLQ